MDRNSGKTMDCYVEFLSTHDARNCCNSINLRQHGLNRILERLVDVTMSSQDELLAVLFPKAKNVKWEGGSPVIMEPEEDWSSGFKTFVSAEELGLMVKHAEQPHRVSRVYFVSLHNASSHVKSSQRFRSDTKTPNSPPSPSAPPNAPTKP